MSSIQQMLIGNVGAAPAPPAGAIYWRLDTFTGLSSLFEISEIQFFNGASRLIGTMTSSDAPSFGSVSALNDDNLTTRCYWNGFVYNTSAFWIQLQLGSSTNVDGIKLGSFDDASRYPTGFRLLKSDDGVSFTTVGTASGLTYPGNFTLSSLIPF